MSYEAGWTYEQAEQWGGWLSDWKEQGVIPHIKWLSQQLGWSRAEAIMFLHYVNQFERDRRMVEGQKEANRLYEERTAALAADSAVADDEARAWRREQAEKQAEWYEAAAARNAEVVELLGTIRDLLDRS